MSPNCLLFINKGGFKSLDGLFHHLMEEKTNTKEGKIKMHAKLQCWMGQCPQKLNEYTRHVEHQ
jgi:hypothetical protein